MIKKLFLILSVLFCASFAGAYEYIESFDVVFKLNESGEGIVTETITANVEHNKIKRGLYRTIPIEKHLNISVLSLKMDEFHHPYFTEKRDNNLVINFGNDDYIPRGMHTYELTYTIENIVDFHRKYDELYWNVTGNDWQFTIYKASFKFIPPEKLEIIEDGISFYTGSRGEKKKDAEQISPLYFETTKALSPYDGFTVAIPFKKGLIKKSLWFIILDSIPFMILAIMIIYCLLTWLLFGKDPADNGDVLFAPPKNISPAMASFILNRSTNLGMFTATLINLALKKEIEIYSLDKKIFFKRTKTQNENFSEEEKLIIKDFIPFGTTVLDGTYHSYVEKSVNNLKTQIKKEGERFIRRNNTYLIFPLIMIALLIIYFTNEIAITLTIIIFSATLIFVFKENKSDALVATSAFSIFMTIFVLLTCGPKPLYFIVPAYFTLIIYAGLIDNTSPEGEYLYLQTLAFKRYMLTAEKHRAELSDPEDATRIFADYLPYAYAFGIEGKWIKKFEKILSKEIIETACRTCGGVKTLRSGLSSSLGKASTAPSSSRSGGGGGFGGGCSGGGHGGGGGGGR